MLLSQKRGTKIELFFTKYNNLFATKSFLYAICFKIMNKVSLKSNYRHKPAPK